MQRSIALSFAFVMCAFTGCDAKQSSQDTLYSGDYFYNFENAIFTQDGQEEEWCVSGLSLAKAERQGENGQDPWGTTHLVLRGKLGPLGSYGGLGRCKRILEVTEIIEISNMRGPDG
ncbi:hypothetical protein RF679_16930 [Undibacterium cyanobacteriorum]|uniref:Lipoprotein n=1 Tax=Undibacterium cyanobacteriorum TaxID=3073561 RepID=A0ABY9RGH7_9BURK|nr:hypothetical protein [Undibacterium sp. 20NA77.5]WMW80312.1 hypothetical protein RF679_16930 [Undibacterium sp. 20NA77.5]